MSGSDENAAADSQEQPEIRLTGRIRPPGLSQETSWEAGIALDEEHQPLMDRLQEYLALAG